MSRKGTYFNDKKGEINDLKVLLRSNAVERDARKKRDVVKKVIAFMTLGYDCSRLFPEMVMASSTSDIVLKKMSYLYLSKYASSNPELATLCINTMTKDCKDQDPMVRGLAVRSLSSLNLIDTLEYMVPVINQGFQDTSGYVRRNSAMAVLKLYHLSPEMLDETDLQNQCEGLLMDRDPDVVTTALMVLDEVLLSQGGITATKPLVFSLMTRIKDLSEWGQCTALAVVARYRPGSKQETFDMMNRLDPCLRVSNSGVVLATMKIFLQFADTVAEIKQDVYLRLKQPVLMMTAASSNEIRFAILAHVYLMVCAVPGIFDDEFKQLYCRYDESLSVKRVKLKILPLLSDEANVKELVDELVEYANDPVFCEQAIKAIGQVAVRLPFYADTIINQLLELMECEDDEIRAHVVDVIKDLLRKYPDRATDVLPSLPRCLRRVEATRGKEAVIWMVGEFGKTMHEAVSGVS